MDLKFSLNIALTCVYIARFLNLSLICEKSVEKSGFFVENMKNVFLGVKKIIFSFSLSAFKSWYFFANLKRKKKYFQPLGAEIIFFFFLNPAAPFYNIKS